MKTRAVLPRPPLLCRPQTSGETASMATVTIRKLPDEVYRALCVRAAANGRSVPAEIRAILEATVLPPERLKLGSMLAALGREMKLTDADIDAIQSVRDRKPAKPLKL